MKKLKKTFALSLALAVTPSLGFAQSQLDVQRAKAQLWAAQEAYGAGDYSEALNKVEAAEQAMGTAGEPTLLLKVKSLYELQRYEDAKTTLEELYTYSPSESTQKEVAPILLDIDERIASKKEAEILTKQRVIEAERKAERLATERRYAAEIAEAEMIARQAEEQREYEAKAANRDAQPLVRLPPIIPSAFMRGNNSGYCRVRYDVSTDGVALNISAKECSDDLLKQASVTSLGSWKFLSKLVDSQPVVSTGMESTIIFRMSDERGNALPFPPDLTPPPEH